MALVRLLLLLVGIEREEEGMLRDVALEEREFELVLVSS